MAHMAVANYPRTRQALHWVGAALILALIPMGLIMARTGNEQLRATLYAGHAVVGALVLVNVIVRLVLARRQPMQPPPGMPRWNEVLHRANHGLALVVPVLLALTGVATLALNGLMPSVFQPGTVVPAELQEGGPRAAHRLLAWAYIGILAMHVGGVVRYQLTKGNVLRRMGAAS